MSVAIKELCAATSNAICSFGATLYIIKIVNQVTRNCKKIGAKWILLSKIVKSQIERAVEIGISISITP